MSIEENRLYLGMDESNNGKKPEIVVLTSATSYLWTQRELLKGFEVVKKQQETIEDILASEDFQFHFMILYDDFFQKLRTIHEKKGIKLKQIFQIYTFLKFLKDSNKLPEHYSFYVDGDKTRLGITSIPKRNGIHPPTKI